MQDLRMVADKDQNVELDLEAFENEIGKEIDALFIPTGIADEAIEPQPKAAADSFDSGLMKKADEPTPPAPLPAPEQEISFDDAFSVPPPADAPASQAPETTPELSFELALDAIAPKAEEPPAEPVLESRNAEEIRKLVESFEIAYLSLDWDFSPGNIRNLAGALDRIEEHCGGTHETDSLYKILRAVLNHLTSRPDGIPVEVNEVMRDAQGLLKRMLLTDGDIEAEDKQQLKSVIARVQAIKQRAVKKEESQPVKAPVMPPQELPGSDLRPSFEARELENADYYRLERMIEWVETSRAQLNAVHSKLHDENIRLKKIEEICQKKPALAPLANRLAAIQANIQQQVNALWDSELEWQKSGDWLREIVARNAGRVPFALSNEPVVSAPVAEKPIAVTEPVTPSNDEEQLPPLPEDHVCAFNLGGKTYALSASSVVKVERITPKTLNKIMKKGYATLGDFKPFFKSIKHGVFSAWQGVPSGILKGYQFLPITAETLQMGDSFGAVGGLILLSNGSQHAMLAVDSADVDQYTAKVVAQGDGQGIIGGTADDGSGKTATMLNVDWILNDLYGIEMPGH